LHDAQDALEDLIEEFGITPMLLMLLLMKRSCRTQMVDRISKHMVRKRMIKHMMMKRMSNHIMMKRMINHIVRKMDPRPIYFGFW